MRKKALIMGLSLVLTIMTAATALAGSWGMGMGMGMGGHMGGGLRANRNLNGAQGRFSGLNLTSEQLEKLLTINQELAKDTLEIRQQLQRIDLELRQLWAAEAPDQAAINRKLAAMTPLRLDLNNKIQQAQKKIENILTPDQLTKYKEFQQITPGQKGRFHPGKWCW